MNGWVFAILGLWLVSKRRGGRRFLRYFTMAVAISLIIAAVAFYLYVLFTKPGEFFRNLGNPLTYLYAVPGIMMFVISQQIAETLDEKEQRSPAEGVNEG